MYVRVIGYKYPYVVYSYGTRASVYIVHRYPLLTPV